MSELILYHHALGLTPGTRAFADELRAAGHTVHLPDLYDGATFTTVEDGVAHAKKVGFQSLMDRGVAMGERLPKGIVYAGFSLGVMPAQKLAMTRAGARGALFFHASIPLSEFGGAWPTGVPLQMHVMEKDDWGDVDVGRDLAATIPGSELFLYPGSGHLFADTSSADYEAGAAALLKKRTLEFLSKVG